MADLDEYLYSLPFSEWLVHFIDSRDDVYKDYCNSLIDHDYSMAEFIDMYYRDDYKQYLLEQINVQFGIN